MKEPTKEERAAARKVLQFYSKQARKLVETTDQERPEEWARGCEIWIELLKGDPKKILAEYLEEYELGR